MPQQVNLLSVFGDLGSSFAGAASKIFTGLLEFGEERAHFFLERRQRCPESNLHHSYKLAARASEDSFNRVYFASILDTLELLQLF